jgi:hypothetical protein
VLIEASEPKDPGGYSGPVWGDGLCSATVEQMGELLTNSAVENAAIDFVMSLERGAGREPVDVRRTRSAGDIVSPPRTIEVKAIGRSARGADLPLEVPQLEAARSDPDFYVYVVDNVRQGDPGQFNLRILGGERLQRLLVRVKEQRYYALPWPVAEYDSCPIGLPD